MHQEALKQLWQRSKDGVNADPEDWSTQVQAIYASGKGLHETLSFLHQSKPELQDFLDWINAGNIETTSAKEDALTKDELQFFRDNGYVILRHAVSDENVEASRNAIIEYLGISMNDSQTWYQLNNLSQGLMIPLYQHEALNNNRHSPKIRKAFEQIYESVNIHPVIDKVSFNPPETPTYKFAGSPLHWDASLAQPIPLKLQGLLYLNDCAAGAGAFHCVPGFHNIAGDWLKAVPQNVHPRDFAMQSLTPSPVPGNAGDLIIWHQALPHCATPNKGTLPRFVHYITYDPDGYVAQKEWI